MAIQSVVNPSQTGAVLLELLISSFLSVGVIGSLTLLLVSSLKVGTNRAHNLVLVESVSSVVQQIKQDVQRAGYGSGREGRATLAGIVDTVYVDKHLLAYRYWVKEEQAYRHVVFKWQQTEGRQRINNEKSINSGERTNNGQLLICEKMSQSALTLDQAKRSGRMGNCFNLFDPNQVGVSEFELAVTSYTESSVSRQLVSMSISSYLVSNPKIKYGVNTLVFIRNSE